MSILRIMLAGFCLLMCSQASAYQECNNIAHDDRFSEQKLKSSLLNRIPVKHLLEGIEIQLRVTSNPGSLFPHADITNNVKQIVISKDFLTLACQIVITEFLYIAGVELNVINQSAETAATCIEQQANASQCFMKFAAQRARIYKPHFDKLNEDEKSSAVNIYFSAINQILIHEYAHFFRDHFTRVRQGKLKRIDAEFEADFFTIMNGIEDAEPPSAMYYFFRSIGDIQYYTNKLDTVAYESGYCRTLNVENITAVVGIEPILMVDAAAGGGFTLARNNPQLFRESHNNRFSKPSNIQIVEECGRLSETVLRNTYEELKKIFARVNSDIEYLFALNQNQEPDLARARFFLSDLSAMSMQLRYLNGVAAKAVASFLRGWNLRGQGLTPIVNKVDDIVNIKDQDNSFLTGDFGTILLTRGLAVLQEQSQLERNLRLSTASRLLKASVNYNPLLSAAWMNLAFVSLEQGNCREAEQHSLRSLATLTDENQRESIEFFTNSMRNLANDQAGCQNMATQFGAYPGL